MSSSNRIMILFILSRGKRGLYELSKMLSNDGKRISSGTLVPIMRGLEKDDYVSQEVVGRVRYYLLAPNGRTYIRNLKRLRSEIKKRFLKGFIRNEIVLTDFMGDEALLSQEFVDKIEKIYDITGNDLVDLISTIFKHAMLGNYEVVKSSKDSIRKAIGEIGNGVQ